MRPTINEESDCLRKKNLRRHWREVKRLCGTAGPNLEIWWYCVTVEGVEPITVSESVVEKKTSGNKYIMHEQVVLMIFQTGSWRNIRIFSLHIQSLSF
jgi:hypothetical protein